ncbi:MAG: hypothetical protein IT158_00920 [Bryobacterales bacterium]|nr:hypothetical protein [Bryobacterales bacterium]
MQRRDFLSLPLAFSAQAAVRRPRVAAVLTIFTPNSHADVFMMRLLQGYRLNKKTYLPRLDLVSMYVDQFPPTDMARDLAEEYGFRIYPTIAEAVRAGKARTDLDGVAIIGEHGDYPSNEMGQKLYPRKEFFEQVAQVMRQDGHVAPVYVDKHFSYSWEKARWMYDTARELKMPLMAGSTVSLAWRVPPLELSPADDLEQALVVGFGDTDAYGFHCLEALQAIVEKRKGGETGVASVQAFTGPKVWELGNQGVWSRELLEAALARTPSRVPGKPEELVKQPVLFLVNYRDGLKGRVLISNGLLRSWAFAAYRKPSRRILSTDCRIQFQLHGHWGFMVRNFEELVVNGRLPNPVERTLLTTGVLSFAFQSLHRGGVEIPTPMLDIRYRS